MDLNLELAADNLMYAENDSECNDDIDKLIKKIAPQIDFALLQDSTLNDLPEDKLEISLNNMLIMTIKQNAFHKFLQIQKIDLSNNLITDLDSDLFSVHANLQEIDLSQNALQNINKNILFYSPVLRKLNFSSNSIRKIEENCIFSFSLVELDLSQNKIEEVHPEAFFYLPELSYLNLSNNLIERLNITAIRLVKFEANNNPLKSIHLQSNRIESIFLHNNQILWFDNFSISNTETLTDLELIDCYSNGEGFFKICNKSFQGFDNLRTLKVKVQTLFDCNELKYLSSITHFQLRYMGPTNLTKLPEASLAEFFPFNNNLTIFSLVLDFFFLNYLDRLFILQNLKEIRIICFKPTAYSTYVRIHNIFERNNSIETIKFAYLNRFMLPKKHGHCPVDFASLKRLTLIGLQNEYMDTYLDKFRSLCTLKLIDGNIASIQTAAFQNLQCLTKLYLEKLKLKKISLMLTKFLDKLEELSLMGNRIWIIERYTFSHLERLKLLNLKGNPLIKAHIDSSTFYNLDKFGTKILVDDESFLVF